MVSAALNPHTASQQPILRLVDTAIGIGVGLAASSIIFRLTEVRDATRDRRRTRNPEVR
jgi:hypothetical protein